MNIPLHNLDITASEYESSITASIKVEPSSDVPSSYSDTQQRSSKIVESVYKLFADHRESNWDGENAEPVSLEARSAALKFLKVLPLTIALPELSAEPDGAITLEWYVSSSRTFLVSLSTMKRIDYAGIFDEDTEIHGKVAFKDTIPPIITSNIENLYVKK